MSPIYLFTATMISYLRRHIVMVNGHLKKSHALITSAFYSSATQPTGQVTNTNSLQQRKELFASKLLDIRREERKEWSALEVGCGSSSELFTSVLLPALYATVANTTGQHTGYLVGVDRDATRIDSITKTVIDSATLLVHSRDMLQKILERVVLHPMDASSTHWAPKAPFDLISVNFAVDSLQDNTLLHLLQQLKIGGRLLIPIHTHSLLLAKPTTTQTLLICDKTNSDETTGDDSSNLLLLEVISQLRSKVNCYVSSKKALSQLGRSYRKYLSGLKLEPLEQINSERTNNITTERERLKSMLDTWRANFELLHKRAPSRVDLMSNPEAKELFRRFCKVNKVS